MNNEQDIVNVKEYKIENIHDGCKHHQELVTHFTNFVF